MKKMICASAATLFALLSTALPAHADATVKRGNVGLVVKGEGLSVKQAGGWMDRHGVGIKARLYAVNKGSRADVTRWKGAATVSAGRRKFSSVDWNLRGQNFSDGTWLCIEFNKSDSRPCAKIHR
ncbi:hypothetical protein [Streptomyces lonegramiae]|uniref:DUF995 domain-containing protein n=1 Tax=Streptomyces lonegramiae TaxID=3075524 RepID=A0ABU2XP28_9ACTN|nr:hypothetical protein [Streptomyces sp. DSM 41529]MDT0547683.1 hypothetical protein [Streptomyces sp. DSM 41529]